MRIQFIGAAQEVTGSCTLLEVNDRHYLVDCGMEQGIDVFQNVALPIPASQVDAVFLTHAHIDHSGMLPRLYKDGFRGIIYATEPARRKKARKFTIFSSPCPPSTALTAGSRVQASSTSEGQIDWKK